MTLTEKQLIELVKFTSDEVSDNSIVIYKGISDEDAKSILDDYLNTIEFYKTMDDEFLNEQI